MSDPFVRVVFVCWGNICRSPMAERIARGHAEAAGLTHLVEFTSAAVSSDEEGNPMDRRAERVLRTAGYDTSRHVARRITAADIAAADLVVAMEDLHVERLLRLAPQARHVRLLTDFDPSAVPGTPVEDPWYGPEEGFLDTLATLERAMPGILTEARMLRA